MSETAFFDTNVLIYVHDAGAPHKQETARELCHRHFSSRTGVLSTQVLQEFFVTITQKGARLPPDQAKRLIVDYAQFNVVTVLPLHILEAIDLQGRFRLSFWDGLILAAAKWAKAGVLYSEDFSDGRSYDGVVVRNPFRQRVLRSPRSRRG